MINSLKIIGMCFVITCCSFQKTEHVSLKHESENGEENCEIPLEIENYLKENSDEWSKISKGDFNEELNRFLAEKQWTEKDENCSYFVQGDFTNNGKDDFAIILENKTYKVDEYGNYKFPFLVIFNDFKENITPHIIYKTRAYKEETVKTVIYSDAEKGILSYLSKGVVCGSNVINISYFEKSGFFVYWEKQSNSYQFLNSLDENLCEIMAGDKNEHYSFSGRWSNNCNNELADFDVNERNEVFLFLESNNKIYINCWLEVDPSNKEIYNLFFANVDSQEYYYEDKMNIVENEISKKESIATIKILSDNSIELNWKGLYNLKTKEVDFAQDFVFFKENGNVVPIILKKCVN